MAKKKSESELQKAANTLKRAEEMAAQSIREQAFDHVPSAMKTLGKYSKGLRASKNTPAPAPNVIRAAAKDIIELAGGRPETRDPRIGDPNEQVRIYVMQFGGAGQPTEIEFGKTVQVDALRQAEVEQAMDLTRGVHTVYEVDDEESGPGSEPEDAA